MTTGEAEARVGTWLREKYRLDRVLGEGGMAVVYAATHKNQKRFAIKVLRRALSNHEDTRARFVREGYVANTVAHPAAVAVLDEDVAEDGSAFLVMELLEGENLETIARAAGGTLSTAPVLAAAFQLLDALQAAHDRGIVHRDIKPANLFVTHAGELKILDFGIARLREGGKANSTLAITQTGGAMMGTPAFMSPEQALGKASLIDHRSDVWSAGATMFSLLTGRHVHGGESLQEMLVITATRPAPPIATVMPRIEPSIARVIDRALRLDKAARWATAAAMRDAIAEAHAVVFGVKVPPNALVGVASGAASIARPPAAPAAIDAAQLANVGPDVGALPATTEARLGVLATEGALARSDAGDPPRAHGSAHAQFASVRADLAGGGGVVVPPAPATDGPLRPMWIALFAAIGLAGWVVVSEVSGTAGDVAVDKKDRAQADRVDAGARSPPPVTPPIDDVGATPSFIPSSSASGAPRGHGTTPPRLPASAHPKSGPNPFDHQ